MKKIVFALLLIGMLVPALSFTREDCNEFSDHLICPTPASFTNQELVFENDAECYYELDEFNQVSLTACMSNTSTGSEFSFENCSIYMPFNGTDLDYLNVDYEHNCQEKSLTQGVDITFIGLEEIFDDCMTLDEANYSRIEECEVEGETWIVNGTVKNVNGTWTVNVAEGKEKERADISDLWVYGVILLAVIVLVYFWKKKSEPEKKY